MRPDTARHPALTLTLHRRPQRRNTYAAGGEPSINRARTFSYESEIPAAININASLLANVIRVEHHLCLRQIKQYVSRAGPGREHCCRQRQPE